MEENQDTLDPRDQSRETEPPDSNDEAVIRQVTLNLLRAQRELPLG